MSAADDAAAVAAAEAERLSKLPTFDYFGTTLHNAAEFPAFAYAEFCEAMEDGADSDSTRSTGVALRLAVACIDESDRGKFRKLSRERNAKVEDWLRVFRDWTAQETERPTGRPNDSSDGPSDIAEKSESQPVASVTELPPRPDLALAASRSA